MPAGAFRDARLACTQLLLSGLLFLAPLVCWDLGVRAKQKCRQSRRTCMAVTLRSFVPGPPELKGAVISSTGVAAEASQARTLPSAHGGACWGCAHVNRLEVL